MPAPATGSDNVKHPWLLRALAGLFALTLAVSVWQIARRLLDYRVGGEVYAEAAAAAGLTAPDASGAPQEQPAPEEDPLVILARLDLAALRRQNPNTAGWILIPGTGISYPVVQGQDNLYYLSHAWNGAANAMGAVFIGCECAADCSSWNTILYGHRMANGSMFTGLSAYRSEDFCRQNPTVYLALDSGIWRYDVFAAFEAEPESPVYRTGEMDETARRELLDLCAARSVIDPGIRPGPEEPVLTLSTCTANNSAARWVVLAARRPEPA